MIVPAPVNASARRHRRGLSVTEMVVCIGILVVLVGVSATMISGGRRGRALATCASNLHSIRTAFQLYLADNGDFYPAPNPNAQWEDMLRPYVPRSIFRCPGDQELFPVLGSSYNWRDTGNPKTTLAGIPAASVLRNNTVLAFDAFPGWHAAGRIQVLRNDNTQELMLQEDFFRELQLSPSGR